MSNEITFKTHEVDMFVQAVSARLEAKLENIDKVISSIESMTHITKEQVNALHVSIEVQKESMSEVRQEYKELKRSIDDLRGIREDDINRIQNRVNSCEKDILHRLEKHHLTKQDAKVHEADILSKAKEMIEECNTELEEKITNDIKDKLGFVKWILGLIASIGASVAYLFDKVH